MSRTYRGEGNHIDMPLVIHTSTTGGATTTAGSMVWVDQSGTGIVHRVSGLAEATGFAGVLLETMTAAQTGVNLATEGVFEFRTATGTGFPVRVGKPVFATDHETVRGLDIAVVTATTLTGINPVGICVFLPQDGINGSQTITRRAWVKIYPYKQLPPMLGESGIGNP